MTKTEIVEILREKINPKFWNSFWLFVPATAILLLPFGLTSIYILGLIGFEGVGRLTQLLILFSIIYGFLIGVTVLLLADKLEIPPSIINKVKWLARFAIVTPLLSILILFAVFSH
jgi:fructose-specific phosphotransferase system IIC component